MPKDKIPTLASVITPFPYRIDNTATLAEARALMLEHAIRHLIVMKDGDIYDVLSDREIEHHGALYGASKADELLVNDICDGKIVVADIHDPLDKALQVMAGQHLGSLAVLKDGELAGIITTTDVCEHFARTLRECYSQDDPDDIIA